MNLLKTTIVIAFTVLLWSCSEPTIGEGYGSVTMEFNVAEEVEARIEVQNRFDKVVTIKEYGLIDPGVYSFVWSGHDENGGLVPEGLYYGVLTIGSGSNSKTYSKALWLLDLNI